MIADGMLDARTAPPVALRWRLLGAVLGLLAFAVGIILIALALKTEIGQFFH